jgi:AraC-like DNA-binding protein
MIFNKNKNYKTNVYFVIILLFVGIQRCTYAIEFFRIIENIYSPLKIKLSLGLFLVPVYYLFFRRLTRGFDQLKNELLHFILPALLILINRIYVDFEMSFYYFVLYSTIYFVLILRLSQQFIKRKNTTMYQILTYKQLKNWLLLMISLTFLLFIFSNYYLFNSSIGLDTFYKYSSLIWFVILIYMFKNPILIFGELNLLKSLQKNTQQELLVWNTKPLKDIEDKDKILYSAILNKIDSIILDIKKLQKSVPIIATTTLTIKTIAHELKVPKSHLELVFKYYCYYSINDFSNLVKVNYALSLINEGYLKSYTVASLGEKCLFNSRYTFSKNFKKFVGVSVSDFVNT